MKERTKSGDEKKRLRYVKEEKVEEEDKGDWERNESGS